MTLIRAAAVAATLFVPHAALAQPVPPNPPPVAPQAPPPTPPQQPGAPGPAPSAPAPPPPAGAQPAPPPEDASMTFTAQPAAPAPAARGGSVEMEQFAHQTSEEMKIGGAKARYSLNLFGDVGGGIVG